MSDFATIAPSYRQNSLVQAAAGQGLIELLGLTGDEDILDVGCGTGNLTSQLRARTSGRVVGIDQEPRMIDEARATYGDLAIEFVAAAADGITSAEAFDCLYCSSVLQWFSSPATELARFFRALRPGGRLAVQAPATHSYCPNFLTAIDHCRRSPELDALCAGFRAPWFFLDSPAAYQALFAEAGFLVRTCRIAAVPQRCTVEKAVGVFKSGAAAGYLNQAYYAEPLPSDFAARMEAGFRESFTAQADGEGQIELLFNRVVVLAERPREQHGAARC